MRQIPAVLCLLALSAQSALAQESGTQEPPLPPPPVVEAPPTPPPAPPSQPVPAQQAPQPGVTPPTQGAPGPGVPPAVLQPPGPPRQGMVPFPMEPPGPEVGLMVTETAFGVLSSLGTGVLLYYLVTKPMAQQAALDPSAAGVANLIFLLGFSTVPLAVAQTEISFANDSHYYVSETWPAALSGLATQGAVIGLYYLTRSGTTDGGEAVLLTGTVAAVPLIEMAVINLTKQPRWKIPGVGAPPGALLSYTPQQGLHLGATLPQPWSVPSSSGPKLGVGVSLLGGRF